MAITHEMIKKLRDMTGAGMMDCKHALEETGGLLDAAVESLRKKGAAVGQKRGDRAAKEGMIVTGVSGDGKTGVIVEINCETDFVGRSDDFSAFARAVAGLIAARKPKTLEELKSLKGPDGKTVTDLTNDLLARVGEKIDVRRFGVLESADGAVFSYTHLGNKIGVLVECANLGIDPAGTVVGRDVAMQIAAMNPMTVGREGVAKETVERELDIYRTQAKNEGKPAPIVEKIANGRLEKFYQEICLLEQTFVKDGGKTIRDYLAETGKGTTVKQFRRYHLGEEGR